MASREQRTADRKLDRFHKIVGIASAILIAILAIAGVVVAAVNSFWTPAIVSHIDSPGLPGDTDTFYDGFVKATGRNVPMDAHVLITFLGDSDFKLTAVYDGITPHGDPGRTTWKMKDSRTLEIQIAALSSGETFNIYAQPLKAVPVRIQVWYGSAYDSCIWPRA